MTKLPLLSVGVDEQGTLGAWGRPRRKPKTQGRRGQKSSHKGTIGKMWSLYIFFVHPTKYTMMLGMVSTLAQTRTRSQQGWQSLPRSQGVGQYQQGLSDSFLRNNDSIGE